MKKPAHQWETRAHRAFRSAEKPVRGFEADARAEAFELRFSDGRLGQARLGLERQVVDEIAASDPDVAHAVRCWLIARGERALSLHVIDRRGHERPLDQGPITLSDVSALSAGAPLRLVSLCPSNAEMLHALGVFERVIACEDSSDYPPEVARLPRLGPDLAPDLDRIAALAPDLVVSSLTVPGMERNVTGLRARGIAQIVLAPRSLSDVLQEIDWLSEVLDVRAAGRALRKHMEDQIAELEAARPKEPARVYLEWWPKPMFTPGKSCYSNELIQLAGGINVFAEREGSSVEVRAEDLVRAAPEVCFVSWCGVALDKLDPANLQKREGLAELRAAKLGHVYPLDEAFSGRPGPRMLEAARIMGRGIRAARGEKA